MWLPCSSLPKSWGCLLSSLLRSWYVFLALGLLTFVFTAFVGTSPYPLSSAVSLPHNLLYSFGYNLRQVGRDLVDRRQHQTEIARLERHVAELDALARNLEIELENLRQIHQVRDTQSPGVVTTAPVTGVDSSPILARITIGAGRADGVVRNMPVTVPEGLVGIVTDAGERSASVRLLTDPESRIGVTVRGRGGQGIAMGELGEVIRVANYVEAEPVEVGDRVETSSRGGLFPRGILVGRVTEVYPPDPNSLRVEFLVQPTVDISKVLEVALIEPL